MRWMAACQRCSRLPPALTRKPLPTPTMAPAPLSLQLMALLLLLLLLLLMTRIYPWRAPWRSKAGAAAPFDSASTTTRKAGHSRTSCSTRRTVAATAVETLPRAPAPTAPPHPAPRRPQPPPAPPLPPPRPPAAALSSAPSQAAAEAPCLRRQKATAAWRRQVRSRQRFDRPAAGRPCWRTRRNTTRRRRPASRPPSPAAPTSSHSARCGP